MLTWPHWIRHSVPPALKCSLVSSFAHKIPSVCAAVATSTVQRCTLQPTIWIQAPYHPSCRLVYNYANHLSIIILMCILGEFSTLWGERERGSVVGMGVYVSSHRKLHRMLLQSQSSRQCGGHGRIRLLPQEINWAHRMLLQSSASSLLRWSCAHWLKRVASVLSGVSFGSHVHCGQKVGL